MLNKYQLLNSVDNPKAEIKYSFNKKCALLVINRFDDGSKAKFELGRKHIPFVEELLADLKSIPEEEN